MDAKGPGCVLQDQLLVQKCRLTARPQKNKDDRWRRRQLRQSEKEGFEHALQLAEFGEAAAASEGIVDCILPQYDPTRKFSTINQRLG